MTSIPSSPASGWSDDRVDTLTRLWREGFSAAQIARRLGGVTRNAVIGKVHHLGLGGRRAPSDPPAIAVVRRPRRCRRLAAPTPSKATGRDTRPRPVARDEGPGRVDNLVHLGPRACKWPIGDPLTPGFSFCGRPADGRYCAAHEARAVRPGAAWRADRDPTLKRALAGLL